MYVCIYIHSVYRSYVDIMYNCISQRQGAASSFNIAQCRSLPVAREAFMTSVYNAFRYHLGSVAFGAFIIAVAWQIDVSTVSMYKER